LKKSSLPSKSLICLFEKCFSFLCNKKTLLSNFFFLWIYFARKNLERTKTWTFYCMLEWYERLILYTHTHKYLINSLQYDSKLQSLWYRSGPIPTKTFGQCRQRRFAASICRRNWLIGNRRQPFPIVYIIDINAAIIDS